MSIEYRLRKKIYSNCSAYVNFSEFVTRFPIHDFSLPGTQWAVRFFPVQSSPACANLTNQQLLKIIVQRYILIDSSQMFEDYPYVSETTIFSIFEPLFSSIPMDLATRSYSLEKTLRILLF